MRLISNFAQAVIMFCLIQSNADCKPRVWLACNRRYDYGVGDVIP